MMKITRARLRQIIEEQSNPGSKFDAAAKKGDEATKQKQIDEISKELQKTVDWFEEVVFPYIARGGLDQGSIPIDYDYLVSAEPGFGNQDLTLVSSPKHEINSLNAMLDLTSSQSDEKLTIGQVYDRLEQTVINQPELKVRMQSNAGDVLAEVSSMKITRTRLKQIIKEELIKLNQTLVYENIKAPLAPVLLQDLTVGSKKGKYRALGHIGKGLAEDIAKHIISSVPENNTDELVILVQFEKDQFHSMLYAKMEGDDMITDIKSPFQTPKDIESAIKEMTNSKAAEHLDANGKISKIVIQPDFTRLNESYTENWMRGYATTVQLGSSQKRPWMKDFHVVSAMPVDPGKPKLYAVFTAPDDTTPKWTGSFEEFKALEPADLLPGKSK